MIIWHNESSHTGNNERWEGADSTALIVNGTDTRQEALNVL